MARIKASQLIFEMTKRVCEDCKAEHWEFFANPDQYKNWKCECKKEEVPELETDIRPT